MHTNPRDLTDNEILTALREAVREESRSIATVVARIEEVDARRLYLARAKPSMFAYCVECLNLSEQAAYLRIQAARAARRFPQVLALLESGALHLTAVKLVAPHLRPDNADALLESVCGKSKREIERVLAQRFPQPDAPTFVRRLPGSEPATKTKTGGFESATAFESTPTRSGPTAAAAQSPIAFRPHRESDTSRCSALSPSRYRLQVTLSEETQAKLERARELLSHQIPDGDLAQVLDCALDALIEAKMKRKFAKASGSKAAERRPAETVTSEASTAKSPSKTTSSGRRSRHIPNAIKRAVLERDGQRCAFVDERGQRCSATHRLEFHHRDPYALGGEHSVDNITLLCAAHNAWAARQDFGAWVECFRGEPRTLREPRAVYRLSG